MDKKQKNIMDSNAKKLLDESKATLDDETLDNLNPEELKEDEYIICPGCGEKMPKTIHTCVTCGIKLKQSSYTPISEKKAFTIRTIIGVVLVVAFFIVWFVVLSK